MAKAIARPVVPPGEEDGGCTDPLVTTLADVRERMARGEVAHGRSCSSNPEVGCVCGWADALGDEIDDDGIDRLDDDGLAAFDDEAAAFAAEMRGAA